MSRHSIAGFRVVVPDGEERPYIEARRSAESIATLLDGWLLDGRYR